MCHWFPMRQQLRAMVLRHRTLGGWVLEKCIRCHLCLLSLVTIYLILVDLFVLFFLSKQLNVNFNDFAVSTLVAGI